MYNIDGRGVEDVCWSETTRAAAETTFRRQVTSTRQDDNLSKNSYLKFCKVVWRRYGYLGEDEIFLSYFVANLSKTLHINFYQNRSSIVEVMTKNFGVFMPHTGSLLTVQQAWKVTICNKLQDIQISVKSKTFSNKAVDSENQLSH